MTDFEALFLESAVMVRIDRQGIWGCMQNVPFFVKNLGVALLSQVINVADTVLTTPQIRRVKPRAGNLCAGYLRESTADSCQQCGGWMPDPQEDAARTPKGMFPGRGPGQCRGAVGAADGFLK